MGLHILQTPSQLVLIVSSVQNGIAIISKITLRGGAKEINGVALFYPGAFRDSGAGVGAGLSKFLKKVGASAAGLGD